MFQIIWMLGVEVTLLAHHQTLVTARFTCLLFNGYEGLFPRGVTQTTHL